MHLMICSVTALSKMLQQLASDFKGKKGLSEFRLERTSDSNIPEKLYDSTTQHAFVGWLRSLPDLITLRIRGIADKNFYCGVIYEGLAALGPRLISLELDIYVFDDQSTETYVNLLSSQMRLEELNILVRCKKPSHWKKIINSIGKLSRLKKFNWTNLSFSLFERADFLRILSE